MSDIIIAGARQHTPKNVDVRIPRDRLLLSPDSAVPGSLARLRHPLREGQRRYVESLSAYAGSFLTRCRNRKWTISRGFPGDRH
jgi:excinuclease UvrABC ATPase subunit